MPFHLHPFRPSPPLTITTLVSMPMRSLSHFFSFLPLTLIINYDVRVCGLESCRVVILNMNSDWQMVTGADVSGLETSVAGT